MIRGPAGQEYDGEADSTEQYPRGKQLLIAVVGIWKYSTKVKYSWLSLSRPLYLE